MTKETLGELILSSERQLYATAKTILSDDQDCADAIQESIVKAFSKIDTLKKDRYAKTWLMRILINECYNIARRINVNEPLDEGYAENMKQPKENRDYSELYRAVNELKEELRIPVILYCQTAHCGRGKSHFIFGGLASPIVPYRNLTQTTDGITADCRSLV